jgi:hypothetical protein
MKKHLLTCIFAAPLLLFAQQTYVWNVSSGSWTEPFNWTPTRTAPAVNDVLEFSSNATVTDMPATESIGKLWLHNNAVVNFSTTIASVITIGHATVTAPHFAVEAGAVLNVSGNNAIAFNIESDYSGEVSGSIDFFDGAHRLTAVSVSSLLFKSSATFTANTGFDGNAFGPTNLNSVIFESGAEYINKAGGNPFGAAAPDAVAIFNPGSIYRYQRNDAGSSLAGRVFGYFYIDGNLNFSGIGSARDCIIQNDLRLLSGFFLFNPNTNWSHTGNFNIYGNIICEGTSYIDIGSDNMPGAVQLLGTNQSIGSGGGTGTIIIKNLTTNNTSTLLNRNITVSGLLDMQHGIIQTSSSALLTLSATAGLQSCTHDYSHLPYTNMGCDNAYIEGPVQKQGLNNADFAFPVGSGGKLRPVLLHNATGDFTVEYKRSDPYLDMGATMGAGIHHISHIEYWNITGTGSGNVELTFYDPNSGGVTDMNALRVARYTASQWTDMNVSSFAGTPGSNGSVTSNALNEFGNFTLAGSSAYPNNPLPIKLLEWTAYRDMNGVMLQWKASDEIDSKGYIVERSANGTLYTPISPLIAAQHIFAFNYTLSDIQPLGGNNYYRLKIIDADGKTYFSNIIQVILPVLPALMVYPNPAREKIFIKISAQSSISTLAVVNITGSVVKWIHASNLTIVSVDILKLSPGLYYIKTMQGQSSLIVPFIKYNL